jgi:hypothetical protein
MRVHSQGWLKDVSRIQATREIECGQDHEEEGHKTENEFYYTHRLFTLRSPPPSNMPRDDQRFACWLLPLRQQPLLLQLKATHEHASLPFLGAVLENLRSCLTLRQGRENLVGLRLWLHRTQQIDSVESRLTRHHLSRSCSHIPKTTHSRAIPRSVVDNGLVEIYDEVSRSRETATVRNFPLENCSKGIKRRARRIRPARRINEDPRHIHRILLAPSLSDEQGIEYDC